MILKNPYSLFNPQLKVLFGQVQIFFHFHDHVKLTVIIQLFRIGLQRCEPQQIYIETLLLEFALCERR